MSNIEKIKAAIERLKAENRNIRCQHNENYCIGYDDAFRDLLPFIDSLPEEKPSEDLEEAANKFAVSYDQGTCDGIAQECFIAGANYQRLKRLAEAVKSSSHLDAYIEGVRRSIEKQIGQLPPPPPGYYYTWKLDTIRKEGQSFTAIARPILKQIDPEQ